MQAVSRAGTDRCRLWVLTAGAVPAAEADERLNVAQAPVWGLGRVYALECSDTWGGLIDVDPDTAPADCAWQVVEQIVGGGGEDQVAYRAGRRHVARLVPAPLPSYRPLQLAADGSYLITGGLGGIGLALAARLAVRGARQLVLTSRSAQPAERLDDERRRSIEAIEACGATVRTAAVDVTDRLAMRALIDGMAAEGMPLRGVFHAAADVGSATLDRMTPDQLEGVLSAKVDGTAVLHELTREMPLDMFVMFSSTTALLGAAGLAHYAAANQFMDVLALDRRAQGLPALAINWGTWEIMRVATAEEREAFLRGGLRPMATAAALDAMECLITGGAVHHAVADIDWDRLKTLYEAKRSRPLLERLGGKPQAGAAVGGASASGGVLDELRTMSSGARREALVSHLQAAVGSVLRVDAARLSDLREGFFDLGMDSLMAVELKTRLEKVLGHPLPSTLAFNYPNIDAVAGYVEAELLASAAPEEAEQPGAADAEPAVPAEELDESALEERLADKLRGLGFE
jgi:NAD(P)-dependent dehydrogenase (short-subunit alcohol dehydrogenase family)/acyl carrier protein